MKFLVAVSCILAVACAKPGHLVSPLAYTAGVNDGFAYSYSSHLTAPVAVAPTFYHGAYPYASAIHSNVLGGHIAHPYIAGPVVAHSAVVAAPVALEKTQYHAQDAFGQAVYGHSEAYQTHNAVQDAAGNKVGSYSYVAPNGQVVAANYVADALGYRVNSNALPVGPSVPAELPEIVAARAAHAQEVEAVKHRSRRSAQYAYSPLAYSGYSGYSSPLAYHNYPVYARAGVSHVVNAPHAFAYRTAY